MNTATSLTATSTNYSGSQTLHSFFSVRLQEYSELNSGNSTLMWTFYSCFEMLYVRGRILIWNHRFRHTVGLKLDLSLKPSNRTVDGSTDRGLRVMSGASAAGPFV